MCRVEKQEARLYYMHCIAIIASSPCFFYPGCLQVARFSHRPWNTHRCTLFLLVPDGFRLWVVIRKAATSKFSVKQTRSVCFWISQDQIWYVDNRLIDGCKNDLAGGRRSPCAPYYSAKLTVRPEYVNRVLTNTGLLMHAFLLTLSALSKVYIVHSTIIVPIILM